jgi:hypothetical protein
MISKGRLKGCAGSRWSCGSLMAFPLAAAQHFHDFASEQATSKKWKDQPLLREQASKQHLS